MEKAVKKRKEGISGGENEKGDIIWTMWDP
jgi:hypothetical protein